MVEPFGDAMNDRVLQRVVIENSRHQERGERGIATRRFLRLDADAREQRIAATEPQHLCRRTLRHENLLHDEPADHVTTFGRLRERGANGSARWEVLRRPRSHPFAIVGSDPRPSHFEDRRRYSGGGSVHRQDGQRQARDGQRQQKPEPEIGWRGRSRLF